MHPQSAANKKTEDALWTSAGQLETCVWPIVFSVSPLHVCPEPVSCRYLVGIKMYDCKALLAPINLHNSLTHF